MNKKMAKKVSSGLKVTINDIVVEVGQQISDKIVKYCDINGYDLKKFVVEELLYKGIMREMYGNDPKDNIEREKKPVEEKSIEDKVKETGEKEKVIVSTKKEGQKKKITITSKD